MKLNRLLMAASVAALTATSAHALDLTVFTPTAPVTPALELEFPQPAGNTVALSFEVATSTGFYPAGNNLVIRVELPAGTAFNTAVSGGNVTSPDSGNVNATIQNSTGQPGDTFVDFLVSIPQNPEQVDQLQFDFDVVLNECPNPATPLTVNIETESGTDIEEGTVTSDSFVTACRSAVDVGIFDDDAEFFDNDNDPSTPPIALNADTFIELPDYNSISDDIVGYIFGQIDPTVSRDIAGTPVDVTDIDRVRLTIQIPDPTGIATVSFLGQTQAVMAGQTAYAFSFTTDADQTDFFDGTPDPVTITAAGTDPISTQQLSVTNIRTEFNDDNANFIEQETYDNAPIDFLQREGRAFGFFDWNSGPNGSLTNSIYRITGLSQVSDTPYTITMENVQPASLEGMTYSGVILASDAAANNGEAVLRSIQKFGVSMPDYIRGDVLINFESNAPIDVDRLMSREGIVTAFGDGANFTVNFFQDDAPTFDSDNFQGNE